jgi:2-hydroxychromene-2-carboxylate isomerase
MMGKKVEFFFDFGSPYSYLAYKALPTVAAAHDAQIVWCPMLLGGVLKATGNRSPAETPVKGAWMRQDLKRWAQRYSIAFENNPYFPVNTLTLMRGAVGMQMQGPVFHKYMDAIFHAMWAEPRNLGAPDELGAVLQQSGMDAGAFQALVNDPVVKEQLKKNTEEAVARGVFGAPTFFVGEDMFWGQDRLHFVAEALAKKP